MNEAICLLSSGLDSTVALALALKQGLSVRTAITFSYGQRASDKEIEKAHLLANHYGVEHVVIDLPWLMKCGRSALQNPSRPLPTPGLRDLDSKDKSNESARAVWVSNRNGVFISIAAALAEGSGASYVIVGFNREEAATFADNSYDFLMSINHSLKFSTRSRVQVISPTLFSNKSELVRSAIDLKIPFDSLWSCYQNFDRMCGICESCMRLKRALVNNHVPLGDYFENPVF